MLIRSLNFLRSIRALKHLRGQLSRLSPAASIVPSCCSSIVLFTMSPRSRGARRVVDIFGKFSIPQGCALSSQRKLTRPCSILFIHPPCLFFVSSDTVSTRICLCCRGGQSHCRLTIAANTASWARSLIGTTATQLRHKSRHRTLSPTPNNPGPPPLRDRVLPVPTTVERTARPPLQPVLLLPPQHACVRALAKIPARKGRHRSP